MTNSKNKNGVSIFTLDEWEGIITKTIKYKPEQSDDEGVFIVDDDYDKIKAIDYQTTANTNYRGTGNFREYLSYKNDKNREEGFEISYLLMINSKKEYQPTGTQIVNTYRMFNDTTDSFNISKVVENFENLVVEGNGLTKIGILKQAVFFKNQMYADNGQDTLSVYDGTDDNKQSDKFYNQYVVGSKFNGSDKVNYFIEDIMIGNTHNDKCNISLFGSEFYNKQFDISANKVTDKNNKARALLFLS